MTKQRILMVGKWLLMALFLAFNYAFYLLNDTTLNLIVTIVIVIYSFLEFFLSLPKKKLRMGAKLYLFTFYSFAVLSLILSVRSFLSANYSSALTSLLIMAGDTALILYTLHRLVHAGDLQS